MQSSLSTSHRRFAIPSKWIKPEPNSSWSTWAFKLETKTSSRFRINLMILTRNSKGPRINLGKQRRSCCRVYGIYRSIRFIRISWRIRWWRMLSCLILRIKHFKNLLRRCWRILDFRILQKQQSWLKWRSISRSYLLKMPIKLRKRTWNFIKTKTLMIKW